jgi:hypothetical protein
VRGALSLGKISMSRIQTWLLRFCAVGLILLLQGPAMLTQEIAWAGMLVTYTRDRGLARGVAETFDGDHPCAMCLKAAKMKNDETDGKPAEQRRDEILRLRLTWVEMVPPKWQRLRNPLAVDVLMEKPAGLLVAAGRGREAPLSPPPRRV